MRKFHRTAFNSWLVSAGYLLLAVTAASAFDPAPIENPPEPTRAEVLRAANLADSDGRTLQGRLHALLSNRFQCVDTRIDQLRGGGARAGR